MKKRTTKTKGNGRPAGSIFVFAAEGRRRAARAVFGDVEEARQAARERARQSRNPQQVYEVIDAAAGLVRPVGKHIPPRGLEVTDRAYRYRAQRNAPAGPRICHFCGCGPHPNPRIEIAHINGREEDNRAENNAYTCRSCNVRMGRTLAAAGKGRKTRQYNPSGAQSLAQYIRLVLIMRGEVEDESTTPAEAAEAIRATPPDQRSEFAKQIWASRRRKYGKSGRQKIPF